MNRNRRIAEYNNRDISGALQTIVMFPVAAARCAVQKQISIICCTMRRLPALEAEQG